VFALAFGLDGTLYIGGDFLNWAGLGANANYFVSWDGAAYAAVDAPAFDDEVLAITPAPNGDIYVGGNFTAGGGAPGNGVAYWDGTNWNALGVGINNVAYSIVFADDGTMYVGGDYTTAGGITVNHIAQWNGTTWRGLSTGMNNAVRDLAIGADGMLFAVGAFTTASGLALADGIAKWNGSTWAHLDVNLPGATVGLAVALGDPDPVVERNYDIFVGFTTTGAGVMAGTATITNDGTENAYPIIIVERSGANTATLEEVRNETTGRELLYDYGLLDGETLTTDLTPTEKSIVSNFFGDRMDAILAGCDFGTFALQPGANQVTCFVNVGGAVTVTAWMLWVDKYNGYD
jgi:hypothetical protein